MYHENKDKRWYTNEQGVEHITILKMPEKSKWTCYLFSSKPGCGMVYRPDKGCEPNWLVRFFMKVLLGCSWVKIDE